MPETPANFPSPDHSGSQLIDGEGPTLGRQADGQAQEQEQGEGGGEKPDDHRLKTQLRRLRVNR